MKQLKSRRIRAYYLLFLVITIMASSLYFYYAQHNRGNIAENIKDASYASRFYLTSNPFMEGPFYGDKKAGITLIAFTDASSEPSRAFMQEIFPLLKKDYIETGLMKIYNKHYITPQDIMERNDNFKDAMMLECIKKLKNQEYYPIYSEMLSKNVTIRKLLEAHEIGIDSYNECMYGNEVLDTLYKNALEIEGLGIVGIDQRFYIGLAGKENIVLDGVQPYIKFQQVIRQNEIKIGN